MFGNIISAIVGGLASAGAAASNASKNNGSSSSSSSTTTKSPSSSNYGNSSNSSSSSSWTSGNTYRPSSSSGSSSSNYGSSYNNDFAQKFQDMQGSASASELQSILDQRLDKLGGTADSWQQTAQNYVNSLKPNYNTSGLHGTTDWAEQFKNNMSTGSIGQLQNILDQRLDKLNGQADAWQQQAQNYVNGMYDQTYGQQEEMIQQYEQQMQELMNQFAGQKDEILAANEAAIKQNIANLQAQKGSVEQAGIDANKAAQQSYMNVLNPNGANAEMLAALGLTNSGMSESAAISAQNAYLGAVNDNAINVSNQLSAIDLAIQNAQLSGDIASAQQLQSYYNTVLQAGMQNINNILAANQWALGNAQGLEQNNINNSFTQAGITGSLNGNQTMQGQQLAYTIEGLSLDNQLKQFQLLLQKAYGMQQAEAELEALKLSNSGASLSNAYQELYNNYMAKKYA